MSRPIDADVLKRKAQKEATEAWKMNITAKVETILNQFIDWVNNAPTIEPERKTGIWKNRSLNILYPEWERYECSVCGGYSYIHKYCPNCGAKMEEGD